MNNFADRIYLHAKIHALRQSLFANEDYRRIIRAGSIHAAFPETLTEKNATDLSRSKDAVFRWQIAVIISFIGITAHYRGLFRAFLLLFELDNIKLVASRSYGRCPLLARWNDVSPYGVMDNSCRDADISLEDLRNILMDTPLDGALEEGETPSYEVLESRLDRRAIENLAGYARKLRPRDRAIYNDLVLMKIASLKILWEYRLARYRDREGGFDQFDPAECSGPAGRSAVTAMENSVRAMIRRAYPSGAAAAGGLDPAGLELFLDRAFIARADRAFSRDFHSICPVISFAWLLYYQVRNLFRIIEGFHAELPPEAIYDGIIGFDK